MSQYQCYKLFDEINQEYEIWEQDCLTKFKNNMIPEEKILSKLGTIKNFKKGL